MLYMSDKAKSAADRLGKQEFVLPDKPTSDMPTLPDDLTDLPDDELMELFTKFIAWSGFAATQLALAEIDERDAEKRLKRAEQAAMSSSWSKDSRVALAKAEASLSPEVQKVSDQLDVVYNYRKLVGVMASNLEREAALVSRELTRRTSTFDGGRRRERFNT